MKEKEFLNSVTNSKIDVIEFLLQSLSAHGIRYCIIGGLAVNAYVEPVVSLDLDLVIAVDKIEELVAVFQKIGARIEKFENSVNISDRRSDLRIQIQTDERYQEFLDRSVRKPVLGYEINVAAIEDVLRGKLWAYRDDTRRKSKRQKDLADIMRLVEVYPQLKNLLPDSF